MGVEQEIKNKALELGFDAVGITDVSRIGSEHVERFKAWLQAGCAGRMEYMHRHLEKRVEPARLRKGARAVIVVALNYKPPAAQDAGDTTPAGTGRVALYAQYEDYHPFIKDRLRELAAFVDVRTGRQNRFKVCVDSAPVAEKALAVRAGLGFVGKNHLLIHPHLGPQILLGELFTSVPLEPDQPLEATCLGCHRCLAACPTGALRPDGLLDATRCISYLTQEECNDGTMESWNNGIVGTQASHPVRDWLFGCDECLRACPFHQKAPACANRHFRFYAERARLNLRELLALTPETFAAEFHDSPLRRLGLERLKRNASRQ